ncbi:class I adenylate-forming enzyme family protein [Metapseudomonas boanensis]|uniref:AMP-binding protein n=1 Tax=Metapseudomonas boanensis TaxID=2822138 RepID=A0ABS5XGB2_9GAMM|nr:AMP-binding protein [Pseudomonas boanensis]MBT8766734.1 AMP-binding protein [Pseudomonas boanensis]
MQNLNETLRYWARRWPERLALRGHGGDLSWGELDRGSDSIAAGLLACGVRQGDRIGILMHNRNEFIETLLGAWKLGVAVTLLNVRFTAREMLYPVLDAGLSLVVTEAQLSGILTEAREAVPGLRVFSVDVAPGARPLDELRRPPEELPEVQVKPEDIALVCYTSGTTGVPKGAMISHANLMASSLARVIPCGITHADKLLISLPLAYTGGMCNYIRDGLFPGSTTVLASSFDTDELMQLITRERINTWTVVPVLLERMRQHPAFAEMDFSSLRNLVAGGAPVSPFLLQSWQDAGVSITQGYGLTEVSGGFATLLFHDEAQRKFGSAGRAVMQAEVRVLNAQGEPAAFGEVGEICVAGPIVMEGYLNKPEETAAIRKGRWLLTGDTGRMDEEGFLTIVDRSKDMLISGGLNVYPAELEHALADVLGSGEFAIIGVPDERWGEVPMIVAHGGQVDLELLKARCLEQLADYKRPRFLVQLDTPLPRTYSGKVLKRELRQQFSSVPLHAVSLKEAR